MIVSKIYNTDVSTNIDVSVVNAMLEQLQAMGAVELPRTSTGLVGKMELTLDSVVLTAMAGA